MKTNAMRWLGIFLILGTGLFHLISAPGEYEEAAYMGYLFAANVLGALISAIGIYYHRSWGWSLVRLIAAGSIAGYIYSRTLGMPGMEVEEWLNPVGIAALVVEGVFVLRYSCASRDHHPITRDPRQ
jgi:hypothetical protein